MKIKIAIITMIGISFITKAQEKITTENGAKSDFIYKNGNIGIGTTNPNTTLDVNGNAAFVGDVEVNSNFKVSSTDNTSNYLEANENFFRIKFGYGIGSTTAIESSLANGIKLNLPVSTNNIEINGNLKVSSTDNTSNYLEANENFFRIKFGYGIGSTTAIESSLTNGIKFNLPISATSATFVGNVGIGTTSPSAKLDVNGVIKGSLFSTQGTSYGSEGINGGSNPIEIFSGDELIFNSSNQIELASPYINLSNAIFIKNNNVGIGTSDTKGYKLGVNGKIVATEVKVALYNNWSDFVFYEDYKLPTLKEVENHIKEKGHLKDIPSAIEVEKNGFFLGEMDSKLLQKIEELTLYTIAQEKKLKVQEEKIISLEKEKLQNEKQQKEIDELKVLVKELLKDKN